MAKNFLKRKCALPLNTRTHPMITFSCLGFDEINNKFTFKWTVGNFYLILLITTRRPSCYSSRSTVTRSVAKFRSFSSNIWACCYKPLQSNITWGVGNFGNHLNLSIFQVHDCLCKYKYLSKHDLYCFFFLIIINCCQWGVYAHSSLGDYRLFCQFFRDVA